MAAATREFTLRRGIDCAFIAFGGDSDETFAQIVDCMKVSPDTHQMGRIVIVGGFSFRHQWAAALGNLDVRSAARTGPGFLDPAWEEGARLPQVFVQWSAPARPSALCSATTDDREWIGVHLMEVRGPRRRNN